MVLESILLQITTSVPYWQGKRIIGPVIKEYSPAGFVEMESKLFKWLILVPLAALTDPLTAVLITLPYGIMLTLLYEWRRRKGLADVMEADNPVKIWLVGVPQWVYGWWLKEKLTPSHPHLVKLSAIAVGALVAGGVFAVHRYIQSMGYSGSIAVILNLMGRPLGILWKWGELTFTFGIFSLIGNLELIIVGVAAYLAISWLRPLKLVNQFRRGLL